MLAQAAVLAKELPIGGRRGSAAMAGKPGRLLPPMLQQAPRALRPSLDLLALEDVPQYQKVPFILCGYRPTPKGPCGLFQTMFTLHNETVNMWTHLLGFGYFVAVGIQLCLDTFVEGGFHVDLVWVLALVAASAFCLFFSFTYHLCNCSSQGVCGCMYKMDLTGIATLITMSYFTGIALAYREFPRLRAFYLLFAGCVSLMLVGPLVQPGLVANMPRHLIACCLVGIVPALHFICITSPATTVAVLPYLVAMGAFYGAGAFVYLKRWPERRWPGYFDLIGQSHQVWHIFVFLAATTWVEGSIVMLKLNQQQSEGAAAE